MPHQITLNRYLAGLWKEIASEFGLYRFSQGNTISCYGKKEDLEAAWQLLRERHSTIVGEFEP